MIKLDVIGHGDLTSQPWEQQWDTIHDLAAAVREGVLDPDSRVEGELRVSVACRSEVKRVNERFAGVVKTDENLVQFEDHEVCRIVAENLGGGQPITVAGAEGVTSFGSIFNGTTGAKSFNEVPSFKNVVLTKGTFQDCDIEELTNFDGVKITSLENLFYGSTAKKIDLSGANFGDNLSYHWAFLYCTAEEIKFGSNRIRLRNESVDNYMFGRCGVLKLDLSCFDTSLMSQLRNMFSGCSKLLEINVSSFDSSACTNNSSMFNDCTSLNHIDISPSFFNSATRSSSPLVAYTAVFTGATNWTDKANITAMLDCLPDLTGFSDGRQGQLRLSANTFAQVTAAQVADAAAKGWNVYK